MRQVIPGLGVREVRLLGNTSSLYAALESCGEVERLKQLDHLGALTIVFPGMVHSRWDYAMTATYLAGAMKPRDTSAEIVVGQLPPMSYREAAQWVLLLNNVGHLPGTFATEKGTLRFLTRKNRVAPLSLLQFGQLDASMQKRLNDVLVDRDYTYFNRVLGIVKCIEKLSLIGGCDVLRLAAEHLMMPFYCEPLRGPNVDWLRLRDLVHSIQRLAYLTIDAAYVSVPSVSIPALIQPLLKDEMLPVGPMPLTEDQVNLVRAYDQFVYEAVYHAPVSRAISAVVGTESERKLMASPDPAATIWSWLGESKLDALLGAAKPEQVVAESSRLSVRLVSLFTPAVRATVAETELLRIGRKNSHASHLTYRAWVPSGTLRRIEAETVLIDLLVPQNSLSRSAGRLLWWIFQRYDNESDPAVESVAMLLKEDVEEAYSDVVQTLFVNLFPCEEVQIVPWPRSVVRMESPRRIIATSALNSKMTQHIFGARVRQDKLTAQQRDQYHEYRGLRHVRTLIMKTIPAKRKRVFLLCPASIRLRKANKTVAEFDGLILSADSRSGAIDLHFSESKRGVSNKKAATSLTNRLTSLGWPVGSYAIAVTPFGANAKLSF